jgi:hypothetical protein
VSDRLAELQRQRALAQEQLAWLDREIARETGQAPAPGPVAAPAGVPAPEPARPVVAPAAPIVPTSDAATAAVADEIIAQYQQSPQTTAQDVKKGCYVWFFLALTLLALTAATIVFVYSRKGSERDAPAAVAP